MKVAIDLDKGQTLDEAQELLYKALKHQRGASHSETFLDPVTNRLCALLEQKHKEVMTAALEEVNKILDSK